MDDIEIIKECKKHVEDGNLDYLTVFLQNLVQEDREYDWPFIFQKVYLHACLKGKREIAEWLEHSVYPTMEPIQKIALRQIFSYGNHLLRQADKMKAFKESHQEF
jgi:hypothetical protein